MAETMAAGAMAAETLAAAVTLAAAATAAAEASESVGWHPALSIMNFW